MKLCCGCGLLIPNARAVKEPDGRHYCIVCADERKLPDVNDPDNWRGFPQRSKTKKEEK